MTEKLWVVPHALTPTDGFHRLATRSLAHFDGEANRSPYPSMWLTPKLEGTVLSLSADLFPGDIVVGRVKIKITVPMEGDLVESFRGLQQLRSARQVTPVDSLMRELFALCRGTREVDRKSLDYQDYFVMGLQLASGPEDFHSLISDAKAELVALLIGAPDSAMLQDDLVGRVINKNSALNEKAAAEILLANRQGIVYVRPSVNYKGPHVDRLNRTRDLALLAVYARTFLQDREDFSIDHPRLAQFIVDRLAYWIDFPDLTFDASVSHTLTWKALSNEFLLKQRIKAWQRLSVSGLAATAGGAPRLGKLWWDSKQLSDLLGEGTPYHQAN